MTTLYIVLLLIINAFFVAAEFALVKVPAVRIQALALDGSSLAKLTLKIQKNLEAYLAACQLGITMASLGLGWIGEPAVAALLKPVFISLGLSEESLHLVSFLTGFILFSSLHIVFGEQVPKTYAIRTAEKVAMWSAVPLIMFYYVAFPINWLLNRASGLTLKGLGIKEVSHVDILTGKEISSLIDVSMDHGEIAGDQARMLQNLFLFDERVVHAIMIPRSDIETLDYNFDTAEILQALRSTHYSRLPVIDGSWADLKGIVLVRDLLISYVETNTIKLEDHLRPPQLAPESLALRTLFDQMRSSREHMAFAVDEFGQVDGLVTLEDLLEEVVGEIDDEYDTFETNIEVIDGGWVARGLYPLHDLLTKTGFKPSQPCSASTVSGFLMQRLQRVPEVDDTWQENDYSFQITQVDGARVAEVRIERTDPPVAEVAPATDPQEGGD